MNINLKMIVNYDLQFFTFMVVDIVMFLTSKIRKQVDWAIKCGGDIFAYT